ncbi:MAG: hypothetical protein J0M34_05050 [Alphaproteobacteria bacterium]|nr:hypothetical protein [Alphaproteobacteria bacterium]
MTGQYNGPDGTTLNMEEYYNLTPEQRHQAAEEGFARLSPEQREALSYYEESSFFSQAARGNVWHQNPANRNEHGENFINSQVLDADILQNMVASYAASRQQENMFELGNAPLQKLEISPRVVNDDGVMIIR